MRWTGPARWIATLLVVLPTPGLAADPPVSLADCDAAVRRQPGSQGAYLCYPMIARMRSQHDDAARRLEALLALDPQDHLARLALARIEADRGRTHAEELYREAADGFAALGNAEGEVNARLGLSFLLAVRGRLPESEAEVRRATELAVRSGDAVLAASVRIQEAWSAYRRADYGGAERLLREVEPDLFPDGAPYLRSGWLSALGATLWGMARYRDSLDAYRAQADLLHAMGDLYEEAAARSNVALLTSSTEGSGFSGEQRENQARLVRRSLSAAVAGGNRRIEGWAYQALAQLSTDCPERRRFLARALPLLREARVLEPLLLAQRTLATALVTCEPRDPVEAFRLLDGAIELARSRGDTQGVARGWTARARAAWRLVRDGGFPGELRERAVVSSLAALDAIDAIRDRQVDSEARARTFSGHADFHDMLVGELLGSPAESPSPEDLELAFQVMERRRARVLLDELDAAQATGSLLAGTPGAETRVRVLERIGEIVRELRSANLSGDARAARLAELGRLEAQEAALRMELARADPLLAGIWGTGLPSLQEVQAALTGSEALLSFQVADLRNLKGDPLGGSWLLVHTNGGTRVYVLPEEREIDPTVDLILDLLQNRDGSEAEGAARLHAELLATALEDLPAGITDLIVIPDGALHRLPFGALRPGSEVETLAARFHIGVAPSASTWLHWRRQSVEPADAPALALVDPTVSTSGTPGSERSGGDSSIPELLSPLPHARREGRAVARHLGGGSRVLDGDDATELLLKETDLARYAIVHLAAHAIVNEREPSRSAVVLAPGDAGEDGRVEYREVAGLDLDGRVVVLSGCRSASGAVLEGEGVMSLARAFFVAGAHAVIGSLWPLRDDEAAALFDDFYRHLGRGESLEGALAGARRDRIAAGAPTAAWSGLVLLGDGGLTPLPGGRRGFVPPWWTLPLALLLVAATAGARGLQLYRGRDG